MKDRIYDVICVDKMYDIMNTDKSGVWRIYVKEVSEKDLVLTFCRYINGIAGLQAQAIITRDDWEVNKANFEALAYITDMLV